MTCLAFLITMLAQVEPGNGAPAATDIEVQSFESADLVYTVHTGPYWRLGSSFAKITPVAKSHADAGDLIARYLDDPAKVQADELRTEIGFFVTGDFEPPPPYQRITLPAHQAATLTYAGLAGSTHQHHRRLLDWIAQNGYKAAGPVMEVYPHGRRTTPAVEIRVPLIPDESAAVPAHAPIERLTLQVLLESHDHPRIARLIIPDGQRLPAVHRVWLTEVVDRLRVIAEILNSKYDRSAESVRDLLDPIVERGAQLTPAGTQDGKSADPHGLTAIMWAEQKAEVLKTLDRIMVGSHLHRLTAQEISEQIIETLSRVAEVMQNRRNAPAQKQVNEQG